MKCVVTDDAFLTSALGDCGSSITSVITTSITSSLLPFLTKSAKAKIKNVVPTISLKAIEGNLRPNKSLRISIFKIKLFRWLWPSFNIIFSAKCWSSSSLKDRDQTGYIQVNLSRPFAGRPYWLVNTSWLLRKKNQFRNLSFSQTPFFSLRIVWQSSLGHGFNVKFYSALCARKMSELWIF